MNDPTSAAAAGDVARLQARVAELETQLAVETAHRRPSRRQPVRAVAATLCLVLGCVLAPVAVAATWVNNTLADTDTYVETVAPISRQPAVQAAIADSVTEVILDNLDVQQVTSEALTTLSRVEDMPPRVSAVLPALSVPLANGIEGFTRDQVDKALASPEFATIWDELNRAAHEQVVRLLEGDQDGAVSAQGDTITLNLAPVIEQVRERMVALGFTLAERIPAVDRTFTLVESDAVTQAQAAYRLLDLLGTWLAVVAVLLLVAGVLLARDRWRALMGGALGITCSMVLLGIALAIARTAYVTTTPAGVLTPEAAGIVFDTLVRFLRTTLRTVAVLGLVVAVAAYLSGRSPRAVRARAGLTHGIARLRRSGAHATGWDVGRLGPVLTTYRRAWRIATVTVGAAVLLAWPAPTAWVVLWIGVLVLLVLGVLQLLSDPVVEPVVQPVATPPVIGEPVAPPPP